MTAAIGDRRVPVGIARLAKQVGVALRDAAMASSGAGVGAFSQPMYDIEDELGRIVVCVQGRLLKSET
jgi:hypothetical protein